jgi:hypothetical protein
MAARLHPHRRFRNGSTASHRWIARWIELICSRTVPAIDAESLLPYKAKEALFRDQHGFLLYLTKEASSAPVEERLLRLGTREALVWLNEGPQEQGSFWG